ncbi:MAG: oligosaccharide flippase family protein [Gammaproteobacteria bacterium]|nr:oligosaccharide flippase family protein [Gammaproteobacteria bacterium]
MSRTNTLIKHTSIYAIGTISRQLIGFIMLPIYTRFLTPADYGVISLLNVSFVIIERLFGARLTVAIPKFYYAAEKDNGDANAVVSSALLITALISIISTLVLVFFKDNFSSAVFGTVEYGVVVAIFAITLLTGALEHYALVYIRIRQKPFLFVGVNISKLLVQICLNIWLVVYLELGVLGVAISAAVSSTIFSVVLTVYTIYYTGFRIKNEIVIKMIIFAWPLWISGLAGIYIWSSNRYFIRVMGSLDDVGFFELAAKFAAILMVLCWEPFYQYWQTERFNLYNQPNSDASFRSVFYFISTILVIVAMGISIFSGPVIRIMAAPEFHEAITIVPYLVFGTLFAALVEFANFGFLLKGKTGLISRNAYLIAVLITALYLYAIPAYGYVGAAVAIMIAQACYFYLSNWTSKKYHDPGISLKPLAMMILIAAVGCWLSIVEFANETLWVDVLVKILVSSVISLLLIVILIRDREQRERFNELLDSVRKRFRRERL